MVGRIVTTQSRRAAKFEESVMLHWALSATIGAAVLTSTPGTASAPQGPISGSYILDEGRREDVSQAIESAVPVPSPATRDLARKLRKASAAYAIRISFSAGRFSIKYDA